MWRLPSSLLASAPPPLLPCLSPGVTLGGICSLSVVIVLGERPRAGWTLLGVRQHFLNRQSWEMDLMTEECKVGPVALIKNALKIILWQYQALVLTTWIEKVQCCSSLKKERKNNCKSGENICSLDLQG